MRKKYASIRKKIPSRCRLDGAIADVFAQRKLCLDNFFPEDENKERRSIIRKYVRT